MVQEHGPNDRIVVVGGGISGIRAALTLALAGRRVTLLEKQQFLGGRVFSFATPDFGEVDIGQHIWLRCCTAFEKLLADLQVPDDWVFRQDRVAMPYRWPDGSMIHVHAGRWPESLAFLPFLMQLKKLRWRDRLRYLISIARIRAMSPSQLEALDNQSAADWLREQRQSADTIAWLWEPFIVGVCNGRLRDVSARSALAVIRESLAQSTRASAICLLRQPLSRVFNRYAREMLTQLGVEVVTGAHVTRLVPGDAPRVQLAGREDIVAARVVCAVPLHQAVALVPFAPAPVAAPTAPILGLLLRYARPIFPEMVFTAVGSTIQHVFNKSLVRNCWQPDGSQDVELVFSAADELFPLSTQQLCDRFVPELARLVPAARGVPVLASRRVQHARATFQVQPGGYAKRPAMLWSSWSGVLIAGDEAATGMPSTMESAARAGEAAGRGVLGELG